MPPQPDRALPATVASVLNHPIGSKVRVAGVILAYDDVSHLVLLVHASKAILVDLSVCVGPWQKMSFLSEALSQIMVIAYLETVPDPLVPPATPLHTSVPVINRRRVLRAMLVEPVPNLSLDLWAKGVDAISSE